MDKITTKDQKENLDNDDNDGNAQWSRDMQLCPKDIMLVREVLGRQRLDHTNDDAMTVMIWMHYNPQNVLLYQPQQTDIAQSFYLMWSTPWQ